MALRGRPMNNDDTFLKVTNKDIYQKLLDIEAHAIKTNGRVTKTEEDLKRTLVVGSGVIVLIIGVLVWLFQNVTFR
jgi:hypothetical protein